MIVFWGLFLFPSGREGGRSGESLTFYEASIFIVFFLLAFLTLIIGRSWEWHIIEVYDEVSRPSQKLERFPDNLRLTVLLSQHKPQPLDSSPQSVIENQSGISFPMREYYSM